ncbi:MAG TPA: helix-turn-helix transcriptional regulator [Micavibrio sp.]|nr:helix-turn-helix transcriptional regulator [Micavibrio sp.]
MWTHENIWHAIDRLAAAFGYSASGLAKQAGLDATSFNKSKRFSGDGKPRWPSTESISRVLEATGATMSDFLTLMDADDELSSDSIKTGFIPLLGFAQAGAKGYFDEDGYPKGDAWDEIKFPDNDGGEGSYALEINGDSMEPLYRKGDVLVVSRDATVRRGDRVVVRTRKGEVMAKELVRKTAGKLELKSLNPDHGNLVLPAGDVSWMARILWVSQ